MKNQIDWNIKGELVPVFGTNTKSCIVKHKGVKLMCIVGENEGGWEHVSVSRDDCKTPTWEQMCKVKETFWHDDEVVLQFHPKNGEYVDLFEALHLWRPATMKAMIELMNDFRKEEMKS